MAKPKPITGCIVMGRMSSARAEKLIRILQEGRNRQAGITGEIIVRERRTEDTSDMLQAVNGVRRSAAEEAS